MTLEKTTDQELQEKLDEVRLFQSLHHLRVARIQNAMRAKGADIPALSVELALQNDQMENSVRQRQRLEKETHQRKQARHEAERSRDNVRQIVCAMMSNPDFSKNDEAAIVTDAARIEEIIQQLNFA